MTRRERFLLGVLAAQLVFIASGVLMVVVVRPIVQEFNEIGRAEARQREMEARLAARPDPGWVVNGVAREHCEVGTDPAGQRYCEAERLSWRRDRGEVTLHWRRIVADCGMEFALVGTRDHEAYLLDPVVLPSNPALCFCNYDFGARLRVDDTLPVVFSLPTRDARKEVVVAAGVGRGESVMDSTQSPACPRVQGESDAVAEEVAEAWPESTTGPQPR